MTLHPYNLMAGVTTLALYFLLPRTKSRNGIGSIMVGLIWPVLIPMALYFGTKVKILKIPFRSDWVLALELTGCLLVTAAGFTLYLLHEMS
jgi:hypothetical protein